MNNSVFISYRRSVSWQLARAVFMDLRAHNIDAFMDVDSIGPGQFDTIILTQIAARPYFLPLLLPGSLERCANPDDWVRREIVEAIRLKRMIVPLHSSDFNFDDLGRYLPQDTAKELGRYNAVEIHQRYFDAAMTAVRKFITPTSISVIPTSPADQTAVQHFQEQVVASPADSPTMSAKEYYMRAQACHIKGDFASAIADYTEALRLEPQDANVYSLRGNARESQGDYDGAIADYTEVLHRKPQASFAYYVRGSARLIKGDYDGAIADCNDAIRLGHRDASAFCVRGSAREKQGDTKGAIADYEQALKIDANFTQAKKSLIRLKGKR